MNDHKMTVRIPREIHKAAKLKAIEADVTLSEAVRELMRLWADGQIELPTQTKGEEGT